MPFDVGTLVHVAGFGTGTVREVRNGGRYLIDVKGSAMVVQEAQLTPAEPRKPGKRAAVGPAPVELDRTPRAAATPSSIDLHGMTVSEAEAAVDRFLNEALLAGFAEVRVIHGRGGGRLKQAVHGRLRALSVVRGFFIDQRNEGVTIVNF